ncbi:hypothetical protein DER71_10216 [Halanaerobium sp. DL-01]|uniref:amino acid kinase family protein n=1 Tax=Halanaerobium sp. DL-01 TaxID=1653064 RepID=UPI000DF1C59A|nr:hypothetical protein [Halanaerobium sp. DL-01]RCW89076.1 hypothetical protein DER71_10216 [Halanaerobium sp. DL-01]
MKKTNNIKVIKIGGSFFSSDIFNSLKKILKDISALDIKGLVFTAGGGKSADLIREFDRKYDLNDSSAHFAAISAVEINAYMLSSFLNDYTFLNAADGDFNKTGDGEFNKSKIEKNKISIFLPSAYYRKYDPLPHSWDVSSDSIALELADRACAEELILLKARDPLFLKEAGIRGNDSKTKKIYYQAAESLREEGLIDNYFPTLFYKTNIKTTIINGSYSERTVEYLKGENPILTRIT